MSNGQYFRGLGFRPNLVLHSIGFDDALLIYGSRS